MNVNVKKKMWPRYGVTGNGIDEWHLDIFWGNAIKDGARAVQRVKTFKAKKVPQHSTPSRTRAFQQLEYFKMRTKAMEALKHARLVDPVREPEPKVKKSKKTKV